MRQELAEKILFMLQRKGIDVSDIRNDIVILLNDYEIATRETAITVWCEDANMAYLKKFLIAKTVQGCTERTLDYYGKTVKKILQDIGKPIGEITADDIRYYLALRECRDGCTKTTCGNELRNLKSFFKWLQDEEFLLKNPTAKIDKIKSAKVKRPAFTELEVEKIRNACRNGKERAVVEILFSTGCRVSELVAIKKEDVEGAAMIVHGKGNKDRTVYMNAKAQIAVENYLREFTSENPYIFPAMISMATLSGNNRDAYKRTENIKSDGHMDKSSVEQLVKRVAKRAKVTGVHPHRFRRTCATFALRRGMPIEQVSKMLGHEQISTTQIYLDLDEKELEQAHRKYVV